MSLDLTDALVGFFTTTVELPTCSAGLPAGARWWEERDGWRYPWRVASYVEGVAQGYPCGEPVSLADMGNGASPGYVGQRKGT